MMRMFYFAAALALADGAHAAAPEPASLPRYQVAANVVGVVRIRGDKQLTNLLRLWESGFMGVQPDIRFRDELHTDEAAIRALAAGVADVVLLGRTMTPDESDFVRVQCRCDPLRFSLAAGLTVYLHRRAGKPLPFQVRQFMRYMLSSAGQAAVASDGVYKSLRATVAAEQMRQLDE
jgi:DNA-binding transcriptional LysR family regulator